MKKLRLKKIVAFAVATVTWFVGLQTFSVSAENNAFSPTYSTADINKNGNVNSTDISLLTQFLNGTRYVANNQCMDVDGNNIVSKADVRHIYSNYMGINSINHVNGSSYNFQVTQNSFVYNPHNQYTWGNYRKHLLDNSSSDLTYTLSMTETSFPSRSDPDIIVGTDERYPETGDFYTGIVYIGDSSSGATGFVVGDNIIATAAHVLYDNGWTTNNYFYVPEVLPDGKIGIQTLGTKHYFNEVHINNNYYLSGDSANDYALIVVDDDSLSDCYHFDLGIPYNMYQLNSHFSSFNIFVTGYPGDAHSAHPVPNSNLLNHYYYLTSAYGGLHNVSGQYSSNLICYTTDTIWGDSGSPVYVKETITTGTTTTEYITVVGIHIGENLLTLPLDNSNFGVPMTPIRLRFYLNNPYI